MRRTPLTTWYSALRFLPSAVHDPPGFLTASSRTTGWPPSIPNCARKSAPFCPSHETPSMFCSTAAVSPCAGLYCDRLQFIESANSAGVAATTAAHAAAVKNPFRFIGASNPQTCGGRLQPAQIRLKADTISNLQSEPEPRAQTGDSSRDDACDETKRRTGLEVRVGRRRRVQHVEHIDVDVEPASADRQFLARAEVQNVLCREVLASVRLEPDRRIAVQRDRRSAVGIDLPEDVRPLTQHAVLALQESGHHHIARQTVAAAHASRPRPGVVQRKELIVGAVEDRCNPAVIPHDEIRDLAGPSR